MTGWVAECKRETKVPFTVQSHKRNIIHTHVHMHMYIFAHTHKHT